MLYAVSKLARITNVTKLSGFLAKWLHVHAATYYLAHLTTSAETIRSLSRGSIGCILPYIFNY